MFDMTNDGALFRARDVLEREGFRPDGNRYRRGGETWFPVIEGKMIGAYDHRAAHIKLVLENALRQQQPSLTSLNDHLDPTFANQPYLWGPEKEGHARTTDWKHDWFLAFKRVTAATNERTMVGCFIPWTTASYTLYLVTSAPEHQRSLPCFAANLFSFITDYFVRQKTSQPSLPMGVIYEVPFLPPKIYDFNCVWAQAQLLNHWVLPRVLELTYTSWDLQSLAQDYSWSGPPFRWDEDRRFMLRSELDAAFFHLYLQADEHGNWRPADRETEEDLARLKQSFPTPRDAVAYIMDTFPIVRRKDEEKFDGEYRTKRIILEIYDAMQEAIRTSQPYQTRLDPPPGPPIDANGKFVDYAEIKANTPPHIHLPRDRTNIGAELHLSDLVSGFPNWPFVVRLGTQALAGRIRATPVSTADLAVGERIILATPALRIHGKAIPAAIGKLGVESRSDASSGEHYVLVSVRGDAGVAQARLSETEWRNLTSVGRVEDVG
jgi:hypothetical protein